MLTDLVSADYRLLWSPDRKEEAKVLFKPGKNHRGYFVADDIIEQAGTAIDILQNIIQIKIMSWFTITCQLIRNSLMGSYLHAKCLNLPQSWSQIGWLKSMYLMQIQRKQILNEICLHLWRQSHCRTCKSKSDDYLILDLLTFFIDLHLALAATDLWKHTKEMLMAN